GRCPAARARRAVLQEALKVISPDRAMLHEFELRDPGAGHYGLHLPGFAGGPRDAAAELCCPTTRLSWTATGTRSLEGGASRRPCGWLIDRFGPLGHFCRKRVTRRQRSDAAQLCHGDASTV